MINRRDSYKIGCKFGKLTVISEPFRDQGRRYLVKLRCECGNEIAKRTDSLVAGDYKSCGCSWNIRQIKTRV